MKRKGALYANLLLVVLVSSGARTTPACDALRLGFDLPGGTRVTYRDGLLRIKPPPPAPSSSPGSSSEPGTTTTTTTLQLLDPDSLAVPWWDDDDDDDDDLPIEHRATESKGCGAFYAGTSPLAGGTFLGCYEGRLLGSREDLDALHARRRAELLLAGGGGGTETDDASKVGDYVLSLDGGAHFLDGFDLRCRAGDDDDGGERRRPFTPAHLNHADKDDPGCNVVRKLAYLPDDFSVVDVEDRLRPSPPPPSWLDLEAYPKELPRVAFFAGREIRPGEELVFDYGTNFWKTNNASGRPPPSPNR